MWQESLSTFLQNLTPATSLADSTHQYSTSEIAQLLSTHTGEEINLQELFTSLTQRGFTYTKTGELTLEWIMKEV
jgi:transposase